MTRRAGVSVRFRPWNRLHPADGVIVVASVVAFALLLGLGRHLTFFGDEWTIIASPPNATVTGWFEPHNEHWSTLFYVVYEAVQAVFGLSTYIPYLAVLLGLHVVSALALYRIVANLAGRWAGVAGGIVLLFFGSAYQDLFWAFQISFVGSTAAGLLAMAAMTGALGRRRPILATALVTAAIATSGMGLPFLAALIVLMAAREDRRRDLGWLAIPLGGYAVWFALFGRSTITSHTDVFSIGAVAAAPASAAAGIGRAVSATLGLDWRISALLAVVAAVGLGAGWWLAFRRRLAGSAAPPGDSWFRPARLPEATAAAVGIVVEFALIGLTRSELGPTSSERSRYLYTAGALILVFVAAWIGPRLFALAGRRRTAAIVAAAAIVALSLAGNGQSLIRGRATYVAAANRTRALANLAIAYARAPDVDPHRELFPMPPAPAFAALLRRDRWPSDGSAAELARLPARAVDQALAELVGPAFRFVPAAAAATGGGAAPPAVVSSSGWTLTTTGSCDSLAAAVAPGGPSVLLRVPDGARLIVAGPPGSTIDAFLARRAAPLPRGGLHGRIVEGQPLGIRIPRLGDGSAWLVSLDLGGAGTWRVCAGATGS